MLIEQCVALSCDRAVVSRRASEGVQANLRLHKIKTAAAQWYNQDRGFKTTHPQNAQALSHKYRPLDNFPSNSEVQTQVAPSADVLMYVLKIFISYRISALFT